MAAVVVGGGGGPVVAVAVGWSLSTRKNSFAVPLVGFAPVAVAVSRAGARGVIARYTMLMSAPANFFYFSSFSIHIIIYINTYVY